MTQSAIQRVGVIGAGQMGGGIAEVCARAGVDVTVFETSEALLDAGRTRLTKSLDRGVSAGRITEVERDGAIGKLRFTTSLTDLADRTAVYKLVELPVPVALLREAAVRPRPQHSVHRRHSALHGSGTAGCGTTQTRAAHSPGSLDAYMHY